MIETGTETVTLHNSLLLRSPVGSILFLSLLFETQQQIGFKLAEKWQAGVACCTQPKLAVRGFPGVGILLEFSFLKLEGWRESS